MARKSTRKSKRAAPRCDCRRKGMRGTPCCVAKRHKKHLARASGRGGVITLPAVAPQMPSAVAPFSIPDVMYSPAVIAQMKARGRWTAQDEAHQQKVDAWMRGESVRFDGRRR